MDQETREFVESQNKALLEGLSGVIRDMGVMLDGRFNAVDAKFAAIDARFNEVDASFDQVETELKSVRQIVERIDDRTQRQVDVVYEDVHKNTDAIEAVQADIVCIKAHVGMPA